MKRRITKQVIFMHEDRSLFEGVRVIEGTNRIRQIVVYQGKYITDNKTYSKGQEKLMEAMAQQIMFEFAAGRTLGA